MKKIGVIFLIISILMVMFSSVYAVNGPESVVEGSSKKDREIAEYTDKYNDEFHGKTAYYLNVAQRYSIPICFIGIAIGALNYFIIGNKKLDKKEQGFWMIAAFLGGLVVFQALPLIYALVVAGR